MALGLVACGGGGGGGVVDENDDETGGDGVSSYTVTPTAGTGGSISPDTAQTANHGGTVEFTLTPDANYIIDTVGGTCGGGLSGDTYTTDAITTNCTVTASFSLNSYTVTPSVTAGSGSISPDTAQTVNHGGTEAFTLTPDANYLIDTIGGTCGGSLDTDTYTTSPVTTSCTVQASFTLPAPTNLVAMAGNEEVALSWTAVTGATDYCVYTSDSSGIHPDTAASYDAVLSTCLGSTSTNHTVTSLTNGTAYYFIVTASDGSVESAASNEVTATPEAPAVTASRPLNDTGIDWCADEANNYDGGDAVYKQQQCDAVAGAGYAGQDGHHGRDAAARAGTLQKIGAGSAGFDFTKLDASGNPLAASATEWSCVQDNVTGLIWEVKTTDGGLRDSNNTYTWYNPDSATNGGSVGTPDGGSCTGSDCDTHAFVQAVNTQGLCGANDWRLPDRETLRSIMSYGVSRPAIDTGYFPNTGSSVFPYYWSSSPVASNPGRAWVVDFAGEDDGNGIRSVNLRVRLVRGGQ